ncbi:TetR/AcrR family transcriptional regulator [Kribbella sp. NPDC004875]|uniref:TetR/AcrR family transcriptional regulator n=1 Tax=Kribbella sp. NPDC004875 TaxID=3364107 RepID=UPI0036A1487D
MSENKPVRRRRRADADRSRTAILTAAVTVLDERPDASLEQVAEAAGVTRQTVYAHFKSRDVLVSAVVDELTAESLVAMDELDLDHGSALEGVLQLIQVAWRMFEQHPFLLHLPQTGVQDERHDPVTARLERLIRRGQRAGEITRDLPAPWLVTTVVALGHAAGESVAYGTLTSRAAPKTLQTTLTRLLQPT